MLFFPPVHRTEYYYKMTKSNNINLPITDQAALSTLALPFSSEINFKEIDNIVFALKKCYSFSKEIKKVVSSKVPKTWQDLYQDGSEDPYDDIVL